jgi:hypothetical protein
MVQEQYYFNDFTETHYRELLIGAKKRYDFRFYSEIDTEKDDSFVLWRHDIDFSIHRSLRLAQIEAEEHVKATYFIHLHSEYYHFFERETFEKIQEIKVLGHELALHFDSHFYNVTNEEELERHLQHEKGIFEQVFGIPCNVFSFHNTTPFTMGCKQWTYCDLVNTYAEFFQSEVEYCSDSNGYWRYKRLMDVISKSESKRLQILTHPEWWQETVMSPWERITRCIDGRAEANKTFYKDNLKKWNMKNLDWQGEML